MGDPLVAVYARCYLCRVGLSIISGRSFVNDNLYDFLAAHKQVQSWKFIWPHQARYKFWCRSCTAGAWGLSFRGRKWTWAATWLCTPQPWTGFCNSLRTLALNSSWWTCWPSAKIWTWKGWRSCIFSLQELNELFCSGLVLNSIMVAFKAVFIAARATLFVDLITACDDDGEKFKKLMDWFFYNWIQ